MQAVKNNPFIKKLQNFDKPNATGQWAEFLKFTEQEKRTKGYLVFNNVDNTTEIDGLQFDVLSSEEVKFSKRYTKHVLESGRPIADASFSEPLSFTLKVQFGDIFIAGSKIRNLINSISAQIGIVSSYAPAKTQTQIAKLMAIKTQLETLYSQVKGAVDTFNTVKSAFDVINPRKTLETRTQQITKFLYFILENSILLNIYTQTAGNLQNVVLTDILTIRTLQANNIIDATLTFEVKEFATTQITTINKKSYLGRVRGKIEDAKKQQKTQGQDAPTGSILSQGLDFLKAR